MKTSPEKIIAARKKVLHEIAERIKKDFSSLGHIIFKMKVSNKTYKELNIVTGHGVVKDVAYDLLFFKKTGWFSKEKLLHLELIYDVEKIELTDVKIFIQNKSVLPLIKTTIEDLKRKYGRFLKRAKIEEFKQF